MSDPLPVITLDYATPRRKRRWLPGDLVLAVFAAVVTIIVNLIAWAEAVAIEPGLQRWWEQKLTGQLAVPLTLLHIAFAGIVISAILNLLWSLALLAWGYDVLTRPRHAPKLQRRCGRIKLFIAPLALAATIAFGVLSESPDAAQWAVHGCVTTLGGVGFALALIYLSDQPAPLAKETEVAPPPAARE